MNFITRFNIIRPSVICYRLLFDFLMILIAQTLLASFFDLPFSVKNTLWLFLGTTIGTVIAEYRKMKAFHSKRQTIKMPPL